MNTPLTDQIMQLHKECMNKNATPANEYALRAHIEKLERDRARLIEMAKAASYEVGLRFSEQIDKMLDNLEADK